MKKVLITGGAGFIGSVVNKMLNKAGYQTIVLDNLSRGDLKSVCYGQFIKGDYGNTQLLKEIFSSHPIDSVMHFGAFSDVGESVRDPLLYYRNNFIHTLPLLQVMKDFEVKNFVFSSSASIYGMPNQTPIPETHTLSPINSYGKSKQMTEAVLQDMDIAYGLKFCCLRYFNAAGGDPDGEIKFNKLREHNLIPLILKGIKYNTLPIQIFGTDYPTFDGTCIRDYIHVHDLGRAHILAMERLFAGHSSSCYNLGNSEGFSVRQVISAAEKVLNRKIPSVEKDRRPGDPPILVADTSKAHRELGWQAHHSDLETMIFHAWNTLQGDT